MPLDGATAIAAAPYLVSVAITTLFLRFWARERKADRAEVRDTRLMLENHLSSTVRVLSHLDAEISRQGDDARAHYNRS